MKITEDQIAKIVHLCTDKIEDQRDHEATAGYGEDYTDGRIVGQAALARRILLIIRGHDVI
jgi:hypothetical protein